MPFSIIRNDITKLNADAIVNAANAKLLAGGGVCGAIFTAAGVEKLQEECNKIGHCDIGGAVITKGYNLPAKYVIHTVGPVYGQNPKEEENQLYSCYESSLKLAREKRLKSVAFPLISSGIYGYPKTEALKIATRAIKDFLAENEMDIYLVVYDKKAFEISNKLFEKVKSFIDETLVKPQARRQLNTLESKMLPMADIPIEYSKQTYSDSYPMESDTVNESRVGTPFDDIKESYKEKTSATRTLENLFGKRVETFSQMLLRLIDEKGMTDVEVYKRANIDRKLFSKIRGKNYTPRKHTVIALAISLKLNLDETKDLLKRAGFAFSECDKFDVIIEYFIENEQYDIFEINETLFYFEQQLLGV